MKRGRSSKEGPDASDPNGATATMNRPVTTLTLNGTDAERVALEDAWRQLASIIAESKDLDVETKADPNRLNDPWVVAHVRWLSVFNNELAAVQTVYEALQTGVKLDSEDIRAARAAADKLLEVIQQARARVPQLA
jgi:hypothetical protein